MKAICKCDSTYTTKVDYNHLSLSVTTPPFQVKHYHQRLQPSKSACDKLVVVVLVFSQLQYLWLQCLHPHVNVSRVQVQSHQVFLHHSQSLFVTLCSALDTLYVALPPVINSNSVSLPLHYVHECTPVQVRQHSLHYTSVDLYTLPHSVASAVEM